jgi:hypothetical protein
MPIILIGLFVVVVLNLQKTTPVKGLHVLLIAQWPYLNRSNRSSFAG